jgi:hypothetical protein
MLSHWVEDEPTTTEIGRPPILIRLQPTYDIAIVTLSDDGYWIDIRITSEDGSPKDQNRFQSSDQLSSIAGSWLSEGGFFVAKSLRASGAIIVDKFFGNGTQDNAKTFELFSGPADTLSAASLYSASSSLRIVISFTHTMSERSYYHIVEANNINWGATVRAGQVSTNTSTVDAYMESPSVLAIRDLDESFCFVWIRRLKIENDFAAPEIVTKCNNFHPDNSSTESSEFILEPGSFGNYQVDSVDGLRLFEHSGNAFVVAFTRRVSWPPPVIAPTLYELAYQKVTFFLSGQPNITSHSSIQNNQREWPAATGSDDFGLFTYYDTASQHVYAQVRTFNGEPLGPSFKLMSDLFSASFVSVMLHRMGTDNPALPDSAFAARAVTVGGPKYETPLIMTTLISHPAAIRNLDSSHPGPSTPSSLPPYSNSTQLGPFDSTILLRSCGNPAMLTLSNKNIVVATDLGSAVSIHLLDYANSSVLKTWTISLTAPAATCPSIAENELGKFIVVWHQASLQIWGQLFSSDGSSAGEPYIISDSSTQTLYPSVAYCKSQHFVVAYQSANNQTVLARALRSSDGVPLGLQFQVNMASPTWLKESVKVTSIPNDPRGSVAIAWIASRATFHSNVFGQVFVYDAASSYLFSPSSVEFSLIPSTSELYKRMARLELASWSDTSHIALMYQTFTTDSYATICVNIFSTEENKWLGNTACLNVAQDGRTVSQPTLVTFYQPQSKAVGMIWKETLANGTIMAVIHPIAVPSLEHLTTNVVRFLSAPNTWFTGCMTLADDPTSLDRRIALAYLSQDANTTNLVVERVQLSLSSSSSPLSLSPYGSVPDYYSDSEEAPALKRSKSLWWIAVLIVAVIFGLMLLGFAIHHCKKYRSGSPTNIAQNNSTATPYAPAPTSNANYTSGTGFSPRTPAHTHSTTPVAATAAAPLVHLRTEELPEQASTSVSEPEIEEVPEDERGAGWVPMTANERLFRKY